jgi:GNAT superfamily N-acetyltransferase
MSDIRHATLDDLTSFLEMWEEFAKERDALGSPIVASGEYMAFIADILTRVVLGRIEGVALLVPHRAMCLWGPALPYPTRMGKTMVAHGTYVRPKYRRQGLGPALFRSGMEALAERGIDALLSSVDVGNTTSERNAQAAGFVDAQSAKLVRVP